MSVKCALGGYAPCVASRTHVCLVPVVDCFKVIGYCEVGMVSNKVFLSFSSSANVQDLLTTLQTIVFQSFIGC